MRFLSKCFGGSASTSSTKQPSTTVEYLCHRFSLAQLRKSTDNFDESRKIGEGPYGAAYRACISIDGQLKDVAVKRLRQEAASSSEGLSLYKNDIIFTCQLHHPNVLSLVGFCDDQNEMIVVHEYAPNGSLDRHLYGIESNSRLSWKKSLEISIGVARGLHYLHSGTKRTIIHRDISSARVLLGENWVPKLNFFGFSIKGPKFSAKDVKPIEQEHSVEGTWKSPNVKHKRDVYSFGELLLELICENTLFQITSNQEMRNLARTGNAEGIIDESLVGEIAPECLKLYMDITESCMSKDPNERPEMGDVEVQLEHLLQLQEEADSNHSLHAFLN